MAGWKRVIAETVTDIEEHYDLLKFRLRERLGGRDPIMILPYRGYGRQDKLYLRGRVLEDRGIAAASDNDTIWNNLVNMYKRFKSNEIPYARLLVRLQGTEQEIETDVEGFFEVWIEPVEPLPQDKKWITIDLELLHPQREGYPPVKAEGLVLVPTPKAKFGVISDIDDTVVHTDATNLVRMARTVFLGNARTRLPFPGVAAFYRALLWGSEGEDLNPLFYVSSSPWNLYDLLSQFFHIEDIPLGPVLFLRDWGIKETEFLPIRHKAYKSEVIQKIMDFYQDLPFILIGDSGQEDPEIYYEMVQKYPDRIPAVYIRNVSQDLPRAEEVRKLAEEVVKAGSTLILADNTLPMAEHALEKGWISTEALDEIRYEKELDEAPPSKLEMLLGEEQAEEEAEPVKIEGQEPEETQQAVRGGAIEEALDPEDEEGKEPPPVIVTGDQE
jgi:phosphatidate phosphatase APP1